jgi:sugar-phosphatase
METKGLRVDETIAYWFTRRPWTGIPPSEVADRLVREVERKIATKVEAKPGAREAVAFFQHKGLRLAVASSSARTLIDAALGRLQIASAFDVIHSATEEERGKPDPAVYLTTAARLSVDPAACVALEDSIHGVLAAKAAGMRCIAVPDASSGLPEHDARLRAADLVLGSLEDLDDAIWGRLVTSSR